MSMNRADYKGMRYKPIKENWAQDGNVAETNNRLKQEFENIAAGQQGVITHINQVISPMLEAVSASSPQQAEDILVKLNGQDGKAGRLLEKLLPGAGVTFTVQDMGDNNLAVVVSIDYKLGGPMIICAHNFNTLVHADGTPKTGEDEKLIEVFAHPIPNEHYMFEVYRPLETYDNNTTDTWPDGTIRGRYQIRWKNVEQKKAHTFSLRFHRPEWGTIVLYGSSAVLYV